MVCVQGVVGRGCARHAIAPIASIIGGRLWSRDFAAGSVIGFTDRSSFCWWIQLLDCICSVCELTKYLLSDCLTVWTHQRVCSYANSYLH